jgi:hypothetical protein
MCIERSWELSIALCRINGIMSDLLRVRVAVSAPVLSRTQHTRSEQYIKCLVMQSGGSLSERPCFASPFKTVTLGTLWLSQSDATNKFLRNSSESDEIFSAHAVM